MSNLYKFATESLDEDLHLWFNTENTTKAQFHLLSQMGFVYWDSPNAKHNKISAEEARMLLCFVALATGEEPTYSFSHINTKDDEFWKDSL